MSEQLMAYIAGVMVALSIIFQLCACALSLLAAGILLWANREHTHSKKLLILLLFTLALLNANGVVYAFGWYLSFPWFHKLAIPFTLLIYPLAYVYTRSVLKGEIRFRKRDWLFILPALLFAVNLLPYYLLPTEEKRAYLESYYQSPEIRSSEREGLLPPYTFYFIRVFWSLWFIYLNGKLIRTTKQRMTDLTRRNNQNMLSWLSGMNVLLSGLLVVGLFVAIVSPILRTGFNLLNLGLGFFAVAICVQLFLKPSILYGLYLPLSETALDENDLSIGLSSPEAASESEESLLLTADSGDRLLVISESEAARYKLLIEEHFRDKRPFLQSTYSLKNLVADIQVPRYILSAFINRQYGMGFREFLNRSRIEYLIQNRHNPIWESYTLEAIAQECGFSSRITFFKNFKQITGVTPSEYFRSVKNVQSIEP